MAEQGDLTVVVLAEPGPGRDACLRGVDGQTHTPRRVVTVTPADYPEALAEVTTSWVTVLPGGCELAPDWCRVVGPYLSAAELGCVGGSVIPIAGPDTSTRWFESRKPVARLSIMGYPRSHLADMPTEHRVEQAEFLAHANLATRTWIARRAAALGMNAACGDYGLATCFLTQRAGLRVVYDSDIRSALYRPLDRVAALLDPDGQSWSDSGKQRILALSVYPDRARALFMITASLLIGSRASPGAALGLAYIRNSRRRQRWMRTMAGKGSAIALLRCLPPPRVGEEHTG